MERRPGIQNEALDSRFRGSGEVRGNDGRGSVTEGKAHRILPESWLARKQQSPDEIPGCLCRQGCRRSHSVAL
ncbi:MAG TPA: hypothetical protein ENK26_03650 [Gammaproteobacteria bacterium]|nr:hypothetical protein [Gammaproteobacteria bacterium]